jgi:glycosyltransferase involved in cell wall biosynthesis
MRFAVDAHAIGRHLTGNEVYVRSLLNAFGAQGRDCDFVAYVSSEDACAHLPSRIHTRLVARNPFLRLGWDLARRVREDCPDVLHVQYTAPLGCSAPVVATVHDVSFLEHPEYFTKARAWQLQHTVRRTVYSAARVVTGSDYARWSILKVYGDLEEDKVVVVPYASAPGFRPVSQTAAAATVRERLGIAAPYILSVGDLQPRKNHIGLIRAFEKLVRACPQLKHELVLAGKETWFTEQVRDAARASGVGDRIRFCGFVADADLLQLYNACDVFVLPSFYEGFGFPVLEAMACGRAVVCSNTTSLPEVADGAAILFDPYVVDEIVRALKDVLVDAELRSRLERLGVQRAAHFSWQKTAGRMLDVFREVAEARHGSVLRASASPVRD